MRRPQGTGIWFDPEKPTIEKDSLTCPHCNSISFVKPGHGPLREDKTGDLGGFCMKCFKHICGPCADLGTCLPFEKQMEELEKNIKKSLEIYELRSKFHKAVGTVKK